MITHMGDFVIMKKYMNLNCLLKPLFIFLESFASVFSDHVHPRGFLFPKSALGKTLFNQN